MERAMTELGVETASPDPFEQFGRWFEEAKASGLREPTAMTLATASPEGAPSARMVLLKGFDERGFVFYTNHGSRKGGELLSNPRAALVFYWSPLERQVRIAGAVAPVSAEESDAYFRSRPRGSRLGAWASEQSRPLAGREELDRRVAELEREFDGREIPRPPHWGGFRVVPVEMEFWQGRADRLHDRMLYSRAPDGGWRLGRLSP
jgi:pyridoxamine 5'-phosphate oxidase